MVGGMDDTMSSRATHEFGRRWEIYRSFTHRCQCSGGSAVLTALPASLLGRGSRLDSGPRRRVGSLCFPRRHPQLPYGAGVGAGACKRDGCIHSVVVLPEVGLHQTVVQ